MTNTKPLEVSDITHLGYPSPSELAQVATHENRIDILENQNSNSAISAAESAAAANLARDNAQNSAQNAAADRAATEAIKNAVILAKAAVDDAASDVETNRNQVLLDAQNAAAAAILAQSNVDAATSANTLAQSGKNQAQAAAAAAAAARDDVNNGLAAQASLINSTITRVDGVESNLYNLQLSNVSKTYVDGQLALKAQASDVSVILMQLSGFAGANGAVAAAVNAVSGRVATLENDHVTISQFNTINSQINNAGGILSRIISAEGTIANLSSGKADISYVQSQIATVNTSINGKVSQSTYDAFVTNVASQNAANASSFTNLSSQIATANSNISNLSTTKVDASTAQSIADGRINAAFGGNAANAYNSIVNTATQSGANAASINGLIAKTNTNPNLFPYPSPKNLTDAPSSYGWAGHTINANTWAPIAPKFYHKFRNSGGSAINEYYYFDFDTADVYISTGEIITVSAKGYGSGSATIAAYLELVPAGGTVNTGAVQSGPTVSLSANWPNRASTTITSTQPGGYYRRRVVFLSYFPTSASYQDVVFFDIKIETGSIATAFTMEGNNAALQAQTSINQSAIADVKGSMAQVEIVANATGGEPAVAKLKSGFGGSEISLAAKAIALINTVNGALMTALKAIGGYVFLTKPLNIDVGSTRQTLGPNGNIVEWFGPNTIPPESQTIANSYWAKGTDGKLYFGGTDKITTPWLAPNAATENYLNEIGFFHTASGNQNTWVEIYNRTITTNGGFVEIDAYLTLKGEQEVNASALNSGVKILMDGNVLRNVDDITVADTNNLGSPRVRKITPNIAWAHIPPAGNHTYSVQVKMTETSSKSSYLESGLIKITEAKR